jgi:broad specificity phosphatase PhoE
MGTLYLVRHGQASFGADDYDRLSELGKRQCAALGAWMRERGLGFEGVLRGTLVRHRQSLQAIASELPGLPEAREWPGLNEYDSLALFETVEHTLSEPLPPAGTSEGYRAHFRLLRVALRAWMEGRTQPRGMPTWQGWLEGVAGALDHVRTHHAGDVLLVSSGGPISTAVAQVLGAPAETMVELNLRMRNSSVTEFAFGPKRHTLVTYNTLPHLEHPERRGWVTFA